MNLSEISSISIWKSVIGHNFSRLRTPPYANHNKFDPAVLYSTIYRLLLAATFAQNLTESDMHVLLAEKKNYSMAPVFRDNLFSIIIQQSGTAVVALKRES